jgi:hypothetical protein
MTIIGRYSSTSANRPHFISPTSMPSLAPIGASIIDLLKSEKKTKKRKEKENIRNRKDET